MTKLMVETGNGYRAAIPAEIAVAHGRVVMDAVNDDRPMLGSPDDAAGFLIGMIGVHDHEVFVVVLLDNRHRLIEVVELFRGTIDGASIHPREVVKVALWKGAAAVIFAHNHPSGVLEPSQADELITLRLRDALSLIDVRVVDHLIIGPRGYASLAKRGLI